MLSRRRDESAFTVLELVVAIAVLAMIVPAVANGISAMLRNTVAVEDTLDRNNDAQRIASAWTSDVQGVDFAGVKQGGDAAWPACGSGGTHLVSFRSGTRVASWFATGQGTKVRLVRRQCVDGTVTRQRTLTGEFGKTGATALEVVHGPSAGTPATFCPHTTAGGVTVGRSCTIAIDGSWTYDLTVARRPMDTAAATPPDTCSHVVGNIIKNCNFETVNPWQGDQYKPHNWACQSNTFINDLTIWPNDFCGANRQHGLGSSGNGYVASGDFNFRYIRYEINQGCHEKGPDGRQCRGGTASDLFLDRTKNYRLRGSIMKGHSLHNGVWSDFDVEFGVRAYYGGQVSEEFLAFIDGAISRQTSPPGPGDNTTYRTYDVYVSTADLAKIPGTGPVQVEVFARVFPKNFTNSYFRIDDVSLAPIASVPATPGVLVNGGFESGGNGWTLCSPKCGVDTSSGYPAPFARTGVGNGFINSTNSGSGWNNLTQTVAVTPNSTYRLTAWIRTSPNNNAGYFGARTGSGTIVEERQFGRLDGYTRVTMDVSTGSNTSLVVFAGTWANGTNTWFQIDDASFVKL